MIRVHLPTGNDERVILIDVDRIDGAVDRDRLAPVAVLPAPDLAGLERDDVDRGAGFLEALLGDRQLRLLETVSRQNGNSLVADISHGNLLTNGVHGSTPGRQ